jgi:protocatechuate 3,4-dioxygenase beta subunit
MRPITIALAVGLTAVTSAQEIRPVGPGRDVAPAPITGTSSLAGLVTSDDTSRQPIRRARVNLNSNDGAVLRTTTTDDAGRYSFASLPANRYTLAVTKPGYVRMTYGAKRADRPGTPVTLGDGQQLKNLDMALTRGAIITGRVLDETGQPAFGVSVRLLQYRIVQGERVLAPAALGLVSPESTDDRGMFRLYGLPPGEYIVSATPRASTAGEIRAMTDTEIRAAIAAAQQQPGGMAAGRPGGAGPIGAPGTGSTPPAVPPREYATVGYAPVYYPGTTLAGSAATITLSAGEERSSVDFQLQLIRTAKIEGTVIAPAGIPPESVQLVMTPTGPNAVPGALPFTLVTRVAPGPDGKFTYTAVAPGTYTISARASQRPAGAPGAPAMAGAVRGDVVGFARAGGAGDAPMILSIGGGPGGGGPAFWASTEVNVDGTNLSNLTLSLQPGMTVTGRVQVDAKKMTAPTDFSRARVQMTPVQTGAGGGTVVTLGGMPGTTMDASGRFTLSGVTPGRYRIQASMPMEVGQGWQLKSVVVKGRDAFDFPLEIGPGEDISDAVVTFTDVTQEVAGTLQDPSGRPAPDYTIVVFPADRRLWSSPLARRIRTVRPGTDGRFTVSNLPTGEYRIAALTDIAPGEANDPAFLELLVNASVAFSLGDGERKTQDLRIAR